MLARTIHEPSAGVVSWTYGIDWISLFTGRTGHIVAWVLTGMLLMWAVFSRFLTASPEDEAS